METPGNTLHAPHTHKPDAEEARGDLLPCFLTILSTPAALVQNIYKYHPSSSYFSLLWSDLVIAVSYSKKCASTYSQLILINRCIF